MEQDPEHGQALTPNQIVAFNLRRVRKEREWTQEEAAKALKPYLGVEWSSAQFSVAERWNPKPGQKTRQFGVDDLIAFSLSFEAYLWQFLSPPDGTVVALPGEQVKADAISALLGETANRRVIGELADLVGKLGRQLGQIEEASSITIHPEGRVTLDKESE
jgi:hypothetical protein